MENRTETSLNAQLKDWRASFQSKSELSKDNLDELESHLLDGIEVLKDNGLTDTEAFMVSRHRIGDRDEVSTEYRKVNRFKYFINKMKPYFLGMLLLTAFENCYSIFVNSTYLISNSLGYFNPLVLTIVAAVVFIMALSITFWYYQTAKLEFSFQKKVLILFLFPLLGFIMRLVTFKLFSTNINTYSLIERDKAYVTLVFCGLIFLSVISFFLFKAIKKKKRHLVKNV